MEANQFQKLTATTTSPAVGSELRKKPLISQRGASLLKTGVLVATSTLLAGTVQADNHATEDLMHGDGQFTEPPAGVSITQSLQDKNWIIVSPDSYTISQPAGSTFESKESPSNSIELRKSSCAEGFFDDGLTYLFKNGDDLATVRPRHIHFEVKTATAEAMETCDLRFYSVQKVVPKAKAVEEAAGRRLQEGEGEDGEGECPVEEESTTEEKVNKITAAPSGPTPEYKKLQFSDVALFRLGFFDYLKLNTQNMLMQYEADKWYSVDLILDFDEQRASIFINNEPLKSETFFTQRKDKLVGGNALSIYGLSPDGVSEFRNIKVCNDICSEQSEMNLRDLSGAAWSMGLGLSLTAAFFSLLA